MTMNNRIPSTEGIMLPSFIQRRTTTAALRLPLLTKGPSLLSHSISRKPVRRALTELGRNDRKHNSRLATRLLTISAEAFKQKWNFDPIKMKPIDVPGSPSTSSTNSTLSTTNGGDSSQQKYQWQLLKQTKEQEQEIEDRKELERTVFSLIPHSSSSSHTDRKQMRLSTIQVSPSSSTQESSSSKLLEEEESLVSSTTEEETTSPSPAAQSIMDNNSEQQKPLEERSITVVSSSEQSKREDLRKRLLPPCDAASSDVASSSDDGASSDDVVVPTVMCCSTINNNNNNSLSSSSPRQSKITDFASHRKIVRGPALKEDTDLQPPSKRPRLTC